MVNLCHMFSVCLNVVFIAGGGLLLLNRSPTAPVQFTRRSLQTQGTSNSSSGGAPAVAPAAAAPAGPANYDLYEEIRLFMANSTGPEPSFLIAPRDRNDLGSLMQAMNFTTGVELGVQSGFFSYATIKNWPNCKKYYLVDIWAMQGNYHDWANVGNAAQNQLYQSTLDRMKQYGDRVVVVRNLTVDAVHIVPGLVDYVFVDARHDYCAAMEDMGLWWHKVRPGGIMAGHDYRSAREVWPSQDWSVCSDGSRNKGAVMGAVNEFAMKHGVGVSVTYSADEWRAWVIRKPHHHTLGRTGRIHEATKYTAPTTNTTV